MREVALIQKKSEHPKNINFWKIKTGNKKLLLLYSSCKISLKQNLLLFLWVIRGKAFSDGRFLKLAFWKNNLDGVPMVLS
jgi:hypothetical protein